MLHAMVQYLRIHSQVSAQLGFGPKCRIWEGVAPKSATTPYAVYQQISGASEHHQGGASEAADALVEISVYATDTNKKRLASDAIQNAFDGIRSASWPATTSATSSEDVDIQGASMTNKLQRYEDPRKGQGKPLFRDILSFRIQYYRRPAPTFDGEN